jgi:hypothetical protein
MIADVIGLTPIRVLFDKQIARVALHSRPEIG